MVDFEEAKRRLAEINTVISQCDDALKPRACDVLIPILFPELETKPRGPGSNDAEPEEDQSQATTFDQLVDKWNPEASRDRALLGAYYVQVVQQQDSVGAQEVNTLLKHHGIGLTRITEAFDANMKSQPALMMQLRKSGSTKQARKLYKVTTAGIKFVDSRLYGETDAGEI
jgi:hypothetical protein